MKYLTVFIILAFLSLASCKKENAGLPTSSLIGNWSWIESCGGLHGGCITPVTSHYNMKLTFTQDSLEYVYQNDTLITTNNFKIFENIIDFGYNTFRLAYLIRNDSLFLNTIDISDGYTSTYKRIK